MASLGNHGAKRTFWEDHNCYEFQVISFNPHLPSGSDKVKHLGLFVLVLSIKHPRYDVYLSFQSIKKKYFFHIKNHYSIYQSV